MTEYEKYLLDELDRVQNEKKELKLELFYLQQAFMTEAQETARLRKLNHELSTHIDYLKNKEE